MKSSVQKSVTKEKEINPPIVASRAILKNFWRAMIFGIYLTVLTVLVFVGYNVTTNFIKKNYNKLSNEPLLSIDSKPVVSTPQPVAEIAPIDKMRVEYEIWLRNRVDYQTNVIINRIKSKIASSHDFHADVVELNNLINSNNDKNLLMLNKLIETDPPKVKDIIMTIYENDNLSDVNGTHNGAINSVKNFFGSFFQIKKVEDNKIHLNKHQINSIILQLLIDGEIRAAFTIASKFATSNEISGKIISDLQIIDQIIAVLNKMKKSEVYND